MISINKYQPCSPFSRFGLFITVFSLLCLSAVQAKAQEGKDIGAVDEDEIFSNTETIVDAEKMKDDSVAKAAGKSGVSLSGSVNNTNLYTTHRDEYILKNPIMDNDNSYTGNVTANLLLDARYKEDIKGFVNTDLIYSYGDIHDHDLALREIFCDFNINRAIYFKIGKQYLEWGNNFWNPSDMINVEKKDFLDPKKNLEGTCGIKVHIPFGTAYNIYGFVNLEDVKGFEDVAWSGKFEFLTGNTEMAFSGWYKKGFEPVFGFDFSTRLFRMDIQGEMSLSHGGNRDKLLKASDNNGNAIYTTARTEDKWISKASLKASRAFDIWDVNDRLMIAGEFYYDQSGYNYNVFDDPLKAIALLQRGLYVPNYMSRYYAALFLTWNRFIISDATCSVNAISNLTDGSKIVSALIGYNPLYDLNITLTGSSFIGNGKDEYTFTGNDKIVRLEFRYSF
jgi:hypothetical protein